MITIRPFVTADAEPIARLFHETVREINIRDYSFSQVQAWAPDDLNFRDWVQRNETRWIYVADDRGAIAGFCELEPSGHIDCFYCHKNYQGRGVGRQLYQALEAAAMNQSIHRLFVEASITAKPFFQKMGFRLLREQTVTVRGQQFINYAMDKAIIELSS